MTKFLSSVLTVKQKLCLNVMNFLRGGSLTSSKPLEFGAYLNHDPAPEILTEF